MSDTPDTHSPAPSAPPPTRRISMLWPRDVHAAMTTAASAHRRDFTHEVLTACDEHLARISTTTNQPTTAKE